MYFINDEHQSNFQELMLRYEVFGEDMQYKPGIYAAAIPEIFKCLGDINKLNTANSPLLKLMHYNEENDTFGPSHPGLTGTTAAIVEFGMSCYNSYLIGIDSILGSVMSEEYFYVIIQMLKIRAKGKIPSITL
ncbi:hypothetical protein [Virgibacillus kimchii]